MLFQLREALLTTVGTYSYAGPEKHNWVRTWDETDDRAEPSWPQVQSVENGSSSRDRLSCSSLT